MSSDGRVPPEVPSSRHRLQVVTVMGALIAAGVAAYFIGGAVTRSKLAMEVATLKQDCAAAQTKLVAARSANALLMANVWAYRAIAALDDRNFGLANDAVARTVTDLKAVDAVASGTDVSALMAARAEAAGLKIYVATDLESQRGQLLRLAADLTALSGSESGRRP